MISAPQAEKATLGSWLIEKESIQSCIDIIQPEHFHDQANAVIARCILELYRQGKAVDLVTVGQAMQEAGLSLDGSRAYLSDLAHSTTTTAHAVHHAKKVLDCYYTRQILSAADRLAKDQDAQSLKEVTDLVLKKESVYAPPLVSYKDNLHDMMDKMDRRARDEVFRTGIKSLDAAWFGVTVGEVVVLGGAPNAGKSKLALNIVNNLLQRNVPCLMFATEMRPHEVMQRHLSMLAKVDTWKLRIGKADLLERQRAVETLGGTMNRMPFHISPKEAPTLADINAGIISSGAKVIVIDSLMFCSFPKAEQLRVSIEFFMKGLKAIAQKRDVVIILVAHLGRRTYDSQGQNSPPTLADFGESKSVEITADKALLMWLPQAKQIGNGDVVECINAKDRANNKRRGGQVVTFDLVCDTNTPLMMEAELIA